MSSKGEVKKLQRPLELTYSENRHGVHVCDSRELITVGTQRRVIRSKTASFQPLAESAGTFRA